ncbi:MAG: peptidylprolyl isomerase [Bryobacteraceae bacterium]
MRFVKSAGIFLLAAFALGGQQQAPPDPVVASVDGKKLSASDIRNILKTLTPAARENVGKNPKAFLQFYFLSEYLGSLAGQARLDQQSPYKEDIELARLRVLYGAGQNAHSSQISIPLEDVERLYGANKGSYPKEADIHVITLFYSNDPPPAGGAKIRTEAEAKTVAADVHRQIAAGGDFLKLQKEYSQDPTSNHGSVHAADKFNDTLKKAIFAMKAGQISDPIQEPSAFYVVKVDRIGAPPLEEVREVLTEELKQRQFTAWIKGLQARFTPVLDSTGAAAVDGKKLSAADVQALIQSLPAQLQTKAKGDVKNFLQEYFLVHHVASLAEQAHLEQQSPYKEEIAQLRLQVLFNAELTVKGNQVPVAYSEEEAHYRDHPENYTEASAHAMMVFYSSAAEPPAIAGHKLLTREKAQQMAQTIRAQLHDDADFEKLQKQYPNDTKASSITLRRNTSGYSQDLKNRLLAMKPGAFSEPIRETNAFYIVRLDARTTLPFEKVRDEIYREFKQERFNAWFQSVQKRFIVTIEDPAFFEQAAR